MAAETTEFLLGDRDGAHLLLVPVGRDRAGDSGPDCLVTDVRVAAGGFSGRFRTFLGVDEVSAFRDGLLALYERLTGEATLGSAGGWLRVVVRGDGRGGLVARGEATDDPAIGNRLHFVVLLDQTYLPGMIAGLDAVLDRFSSPV